MSPKRGHRVWSDEMAKAHRGTKYQTEPNFKSMYASKWQTRTANMSSGRPSHSNAVLAFRLPKAKAVRCNSCQLLISKCGCQPYRWTCHIACVQGTLQEVIPKISMAWMHCLEAYLLHQPRAGELAEAATIRCVACSRGLLGPKVNGEVLLKVGQRGTWHGNCGLFKLQLKPGWTEPEPRARSPGKFAFLAGILVVAATLVTAAALSLCDLRVVHLFLRPCCLFGAYLRPKKTSGAKTAGEAPSPDQTYHRHRYRRMVGSHIL